MRAFSRLLHSVRVCKRSLSELKHTQSPNPQWTPGQNQPLPFASRGATTVNCNAIEELVNVHCHCIFWLLVWSEWRRFDPATEKHIYALAISGVVPRCIAFVSSMNRQQQANLAPFSYFSAMGHGADDRRVIVVGLSTKVTEDECVSSCRPAHPRDRADHAERGQEPHAEEYRGDRVSVCVARGLRFVCGFKATHNILHYRRHFTPGSSSSTSSASGSWNRPTIAPACSQKASTKPRWRG